MVNDQITGIESGRASDQEVIDRRAQAWQTRPLLRDVYREYFEQMRQHFASDATAATPYGTVVEVGGGSGHFRSFYPQMIVTDVLPTRHIHLAADAMHLPFRDSSVNNIVMQDVLHHLPLPLRFFSEAQRVLKVGGRVVMTEPFISPVSGLCYRLSHPEPVDMDAPLFRSQSNPVRGVCQQSSHPHSIIFPISWTVPAPFSPSVGDPPGGAFHHGVSSFRRLFQAGFAAAVCRACGPDAGKDAITADAMDGVPVVDRGGKAGVGAQ